MTFDGFFMYHLNNELHTKLLHARITKIHQPSEHDLILSMRGYRENVKLYLTIHPNFSRYHLTQDKFLNPEIAPNFCMVLRKYLENAKLTHIQQLGLDRITTFSFQKQDEFGYLSNFHLTIELMGRHSNIFLVNPENNQIIDCMKYVSLSKNSYRTTRPNSQYMLPPYQHKLNLLTIDDMTLKEICARAPIEINKLSQYLQSNFQGLGKSTLYWIIDKIQQHHTLYDTLRLLTLEKTNGTIYQNDYLPIAFQGKPFNTLSELLDTFYEEQSKLARFSQMSGNLITQLTNSLNKNKLKLEKLQQDKEQSENSELFKIKGELLTTYAYVVKQGQTSVTLDNYYDHSKLTITLKPQLSAIENAQYYFKKYQKLKQSTLYITEQIQRTQDEINYLESVFVQIHMAQNEDLVAIKQELIETGYIKNKSLFKRKNKLPKLQPLKFIATDGTTILVGRNNLQNDYLTLKYANKNHLWLHAKDIPGAHVIIESDHPIDETIGQACHLAAYYSKFQLAANVPIDYVKVKHIKKPNGSKPGFVIYENQQTTYITPDIDLINQLRVN